MSFDLPENFDLFRKTDAGSPNKTKVHPFVKSEKYHSHHIILK